MTPETWDAAQRALYDAIADDYDAHFSDEHSRRYRARFIIEPLLAGVNLEDAAVLEAMCGGGEVTGALIDAGAEVTGLDISAGMLARFQSRWPQCQAVRASIFDSALPASSFDAVVVLSGLHHLHPRVGDAIDEIHRVLKPGGTFCFSEPHAGSAPDMIRRLWYRFDRQIFERNEAGIDLAALEAANASRFDFVKTSFGGNIAYVLVLHSLVLRIPLWLKKWYSPLVLPLERPIARLQGKATSCFMVCQWKKKHA